MGYGADLLWPIFEAGPDRRRADPDPACGTAARVHGGGIEAGAEGIFDVIRGVIVGKPARRSKYEPYKQVYRRVVGREAHHPEIPILYNVNFGHADPIGIIPYGVKCRLDADNRTLTLLEPATA